jgi:predicted dehydrogenase
MQNYKFLIVGYGSIGKKHYECLKKNFPSNNIKVLTTKKINHKDFINESSDALAFHADIVLVCNPAHLHIETAIKFARTGSNIFIEKPLDISLKNINILKKISNTNNIKIQIGYNLRYLKSLQFFRKILLSKKYGIPLAFHAEVGQRLDQWRKNKSPISKSISLNKSKGGGAINELSHEIDYLLWIFDNLQFSHSLSSSLFYKKSDVEDYSIIQFKKKSRRKLDLLGSLSLDMIRLTHTRFCEVITSHGRIRWCGINFTVEVSYKNSTKLFSFKDDSFEASYLRQFRSLMMAIKNNTETLCNLEDGIKTYKIIQKIKESNK